MLSLILECSTCFVWDVCSTLAMLRFSHCLLRVSQLSQAWNEMKYERQVNFNVSSSCELFFSKQIQILSM